MKTDFIEVKNLTKTFKTGQHEINALKNISFSVNEGKMIILLGRSGSGKSTLFNIMGGIDSPTEGNVLINGEDICKMNQRQKTLYRRNTVGLVFQNYNLFSDLNGYENIKIAAEYAVDPFNITEISEKLGIVDLLERFPGQLSGGEQQRIAIARALVKNPDLILCDEPTAALDTSTTINFLEMITDCCKLYNKTVIMITHNLEITRIADTIITLSDGKIKHVEENTNIIEPEDIVWGCEYV